MEKMGGVYSSNGKQNKKWVTAEAISPFFTGRGERILTFDPLLPKEGVLANLCKEQAKFNFSKKKSGANGLLSSFKFRSFQ